LIFFGYIQYGVMEFGYSIRGNRRLEKIRCLNAVYCLFYW
jgi:hypothetical protein